VSDREATGKMNRRLWSKTAPGRLMSLVAVTLVLLPACAPAAPAPAPMSTRSSTPPLVIGTPPTIDSTSMPAAQPVHQASSPAPQIASALPPGVVGERGVVVEVIDGDTVTVQLDGQRAVVRLIGIDAPESRGPYTEPECHAAEARETLQRLIASAGGEIVLERDTSELDRYDRLLRYLWMPAGEGWVLVNEELVRQGAAVSRRYPPDVKYAERLEAAERAAQAARVGLWSACRQPATPAPAAPSTTETERLGCEPAYPDVCVRPPPPDLDCPDIPYRRFRVLPPDPHRFDRDGDGIGCEG